LELYEGEENVAQQQAKKAVILFYRFWRLVHASDIDEFIYLKIGGLAKY